ncbi:hypothetical protein [Kitasatospora sp. NPDC101183]|uniref:hypothetical protein n=1 Tax=Kitasatospora sp. NPDC101183 TaxID=3364100 RepID=UPI00382D9F64
MAVVDVGAVVVALVVTVLVLRAFGFGGFLPVLIGGCAGAATVRLRLGARLVRG